MDERIVGRRLAVEEDLGLDGRDEVAVVGIGDAVVVDDGVHREVHLQRVGQFADSVGRDEYRREMPSPESRNRHFLLSCSCESYK